MKRLIPIAAAAAIACSAGATLVKVQVNGTVEYDQFSTGPLAGIPAGSAASMSFLLDSNNFVNSQSFPTRGYVIDKDSFSLTMGAKTIGLENPYPAGQTPYFVLRNNDPAVDGFFIAENVDFFGGVDTSVANVDMAFSATYTSSNVLSSLNILDAVGSYSLAGISSFNWTLDVGPSSPLGMIYESMTISVVPAPAALALLGLGGLVGRRRRPC
ncbi:MAG: hypothetical protein U0575_08025 [Phycisphaerales bacterium]